MDAEMAQAGRWAAAKFEGVLPESATPEDAITVTANHGPVQPNARAGEPLRIAGATFTHGLYCHAPSKLTVRLSKPAKQFEGVAGIDSRAGGGSVVFSVRSGDSELWTSGLVRYGDPGIPVAVPLDGAREFSIQVGDAGDGISCDQANWADARVTLGDGTVVRLGDLPILGQEREPYTTDPFFSFTYGDRPSSEFLSQWESTRTSLKLDTARTRHELTYTDPETGLVVRCAGVEYGDSPTVEWTLHFKNTGTTDTPILSDILAMDSRFACPPMADFTLHHNKGDNCTADSYEPLVDALGPNADMRLANTGGRPTQIEFPYYNLAEPGGGIIFVVSWAGQWNARFTRDNAGALRLRAGQELTHFTLHPGEEVRSPMIVLQFYKGDWVRGQNLWRSWMVAHNMPRQNGEPLKPQVSLCTGNYYPALMSTADGEIAFIRRYAEEGIKADYWWQDAGWYPCDGVGWPKVGTWEVDPVRFPNGLREVGDFARTHGMKTLIWFEPERVHGGTWVAENHPEWVHGGAGGGLLKLSDPACRAWLTDHIDKLITDQRIDFYRQDFNIDPLGYWRGSDAEDRQGITEIRHVEGYLAYWDELQRRHPGMPIDSCASGGRRNDLETLRRAVPLLRSDWYAAPAGQQCQTYGLSLWFPFNGTGVISQKGIYWMRSSMVAEFTFGPDAAGADVIDFAQLRQCMDDWRLLADCFFGDFHPLTPYSLAEDQWMAWQYHQSELDKGTIQVFRRGESVYEAARLRLRGLEPAAHYRIADVDSGPLPEMTGEELMEHGVLVTLPSRPQAAILVYSRAD
jgi:alpha-galactosidase